MTGGREARGHGPQPRLGGESWRERAAAVSDRHCGVLLTLLGQCAQSYALIIARPDGAYKHRFKREYGHWLAGSARNACYGARSAATAPCPAAPVCNNNIYIKRLQFSYRARVVRAPRTPYPASRPIFAPLILLHAETFARLLARAMYIPPRAVR